MPAAERLQSVRHFALDLDGTVYHGDTLCPHASEFLTGLAERGIGHSFLTNNSSRSTEHYVRRLQGLGLVAETDAILTSTDATVEFLRTAHPDVRRLYVLGTSDLQTELGAQGFELTQDDPDDEPDAVIAGFDMDLDYQRMCRAAWWISVGKPYIATHPDRVCPTDARNVLIDCGAICAALQCATGRMPDAIPGKPDRRMLQTLMRRHGLEPGELAMVGDRLYTDIAMARSAGVLGILVLTGEATAADAANCDEPPDLVVADLFELDQLLSEVGSGD